MSPEAPFVGSQRGFNHPAQTADLAFCCANKNASALENVSCFVPELSESAIPGAGQQSRSSTTRMWAQQQLLCCERSRPASGRAARGVQRLPGFLLEKSLVGVFHCWWNGQRQNTCPVCSIPAAPIWQQLPSQLFSTLGL